ncbi:MAG: hypothetical protein WKH64_07685 [Chloroflexia bacterium]
MIETSHVAQTFEDKILGWLADHPSLEELKMLAGDLTEEEHKLLAEMDMDVEPTEEDLVDFGPEFIQGVVDRVLADSSMRLEPAQVSGPTGGPEMTQTLEQGYRYLSLFKTMDSNPVVSKKAEQLAESLGDLMIAKAELAYRR